MRSLRATVLDRHDIACRNARLRSGVTVDMTCHPRTACRPLGGRPRGRLRSGRSVAWSAALLLSVLLVGCGSSPRATPYPPGPSATSPAANIQQTTDSASPGFSNVFRHALLNPQVTVTSGAIFVAWQTAPPGSAAVGSELVRIDGATGRIEASQRFSAFVQQVLEAAGSLWVATWTGSVPAAATLLRLNQETLQVTRRWHIGIGGEPDWAGQVLVVAGGRLWAAGGDRLMRVSLPSGTRAASIALPGAASSDLSANAAGTELIVGEADSEGQGAVQRRDAATGAVLAARRVSGVAAPMVAGPVGSAVWITEPTGMMGYIQRLDAASMTADKSNCAEGKITGTCVSGTNDITARIADGVLWVTQVAGGKMRNYCADPVDGRKRAPIELPQPTEDIVLAIAPHQIFYAAPGPKAGHYLRREPISSACRAH